MSRARPSPRLAEPRRLPRGRHALAPELVLADQRERLLAAVPGAIAERGYAATSVADLVKRAAVSRNAFYNNFNDKQECFAAAHEACHERLLEILTLPCDPDATIEKRVENALAAGLEALSSDPDAARLLFVEAPASAGEEVARRYHEWLQRYGDLLRSVGPASTPLAGMEQLIVGGIATRIASEVLKGRAAELRTLTQQLVEYVVAFHGPGRLEPSSGTVVALEA